MTYDDVMRWSDAERSALLGEWLRDGGEVLQYTCTQCERECTEDVHWVSGVVGTPSQAFITCAGALGRVYLRPEELRQWVVDRRLISDSLSRMLATKGDLQEVITGRLWWLGRRELRGRQVAVYLAMGTGRRDAGMVYAGTLGTQSTPQLVLVPGTLPSSSLFGAAAIVLSLSQIVEFAPTGLRLDMAAVEQAIPKSRARVAPEVVPFRTDPGTTWDRIMMEFLDDETVRVSVPGRAPEERSFVGMGFQDHRKAGEQSDALWELLRLLAKEQGQLGSEDSARVIPAATFGKVKKWIADIRKRLHALFPDVGGDPFKPYRKVKAYETKFILRWAGDAR